MTYCQKNGFCVVLFIAVYVEFIHLTKGEVKMVSACHGTSSQTCNYITLECNAGFRIRVLSMEYGVKDYECDANEKRSHCLNPDKNGCCVHRVDDCMKSYNSLHAYNLHTQCSGKQKCEPMPVPDNILTNCTATKVPSTYVQVMYECQSDDTVVSFCNVERMGVKKIDLIFNTTSDSFSIPRTCSCFVSSTTSINIDYVDVRMTKEQTSSPGSACSSATLTTTPANDIDTTCDTSENEESNFVYGDIAVMSESNVEIKLLDLYKNGNSDAPTLIWLTVIAEGPGMLNMSCFEHADTPTTIPSTISPSTYVPTTSSSSNNTINGDDGSNTGAIVAGVLVPIVLLAIIGAVVAFLVWKRRGYLWKKRTPARPNSYTNNVCIETNSVETDAYAVIGYVPDIPDTNRKCDPVHNSKNKQMPPQSDNPSCNGHTYQNINNVDKVKNKQSKKPRWPLRTLKSQTDKFISHFRHKTENDIPQVKTQPDRDVSIGSYDHLRPISANSLLQIQVTAPVDKPTHVYSHTTDLTVKKQTALSQERTKNNVTNQPSPSIEKQSQVEVNAVNVGDMYIEFQSGAIDTNNPNLIKAPEIGVTVENERPHPPSRPPPSPSIAAKLKRSPSPNPKLNLPAPNEQNDIRQKSSNHLSQDQSSPDSEVNYDYAEGVHVQSRSTSPRGSDATNSDITSEHSYKILEEQQFYDYADVSNADVVDEEEAYQPGSIYENVDKVPRLDSVRKHKSANDIPQDHNGYLEPVSTRTRAISSFGVNTEVSSKNNAKTAPVSKDSLLKRELKEKTQQLKDKTQQRRQAKHNEDSAKNGNETKDNYLTEKDNTKVDNSGKTIKSDNTDTKDYQMVDKMKGVLRMAKLFENKDSDSDTSRKSSPRHIQVRGTSPHASDKNVNRTSSDL